MLVSALKLPRDDRVGKHSHISYFFFMPRARSTSPSASSASDIQDLSDALHQLSLAQAHVDRVLHRLQTRSSLPVALAVEVSPAHVSPPRPSSRTLAAGLQVGDFVRINRPNRTQLGEGELIGVTRSGFLQIRTADGTIVLRIPANVTRIGHS